MFPLSKLAINRKFIDFLIFINPIKKKLKKIDRNLFKNCKIFMF